MVTNFRVKGFTIALTIISLCWFIVCIPAINNYNDMMLHWLCWFLFFYCLITWKKETKDSWFSLYNIFLLFLFCFNLGQPLLWAFGLHFDREIGSSLAFYSVRFSKIDVYFAELYSALCIFILHLTALITTKIVINRNKSRFSSRAKNNLNKDNLLKIGIILLLTTTPFVFYVDIKSFFVALSSGYHSLFYENQVNSGYLQIIQFLFFPSIVAVLIGSNYEKKYKYICYFLFGIHAVFTLLSGRRGIFLIPLVLLVWLHSKYQLVSRKKIVAFLALGFVGIYFLNFIKSSRDYGSMLDFSSFVSSLNSADNPFFDSVLEMGGSMQIVAFLMKEGRGIYPFSNSYAVSVLGSISSRFLSVLGIEQVLLSNWLTDYLGLNYGTGFSMIGESFINSGSFFGSFYMVVFGSLFGILFAYSISIHDKKNIGLFVTISSLYLIIQYLRNSLYLPLKAFVYGPLLIILLVWVLNNFTSENRQHGFRKGNL